MTSKQIEAISNAAQISARRIEDELLASRVFTNFIKFNEGDRDFIVWMISVATKTLMEKKRNTKENHPCG